MGKVQRIMAAACLGGALTMTAMGHPGEEARGPVPRVPDPQLVARLIADETGVVQREIHVAVVLEVEAEMCDGVVAVRSAHATFIWPVLEDGHRVRKAGERTFHWNQELGWFMYRLVHPRGGEAVDICSEHKGLIRVR